MTQAMDAARSGMMQHERNLELIANNLANMNTTGYKRLAVHFQDLLTSEQALDVLFEGESVSPASGVALDATQRIFTMGSLIAQDQPLAMAIRGDGFFQVRLDATTVAYTRDGTFSLDAEGFIVTTDGYRLEPPVEIQGPVAELVVRPDGVVMVRPGRNDELGEVGQIQVAVFTDPGQLQSAGQNLFLATADSGAAQVVTPGNDGSGPIESGALEASNVELATEMTNLIAAQRAYQFNLVAFQTADEMMQQLNNAVQA